MFDRLLRAMHARDIDSKIRRYGWAGQYVGDYNSFPTWAYSIGFDETLNQPEVIFFDIPEADAKTLMWEIAETLRAGRLEIKDNELWAPEDEVVGVWRRVHPSQIDCDDGWLVGAVNRRQRRLGSADGLRVFQLVVSDASHKFPWDEGYDERIRPRQPALWLPAQDYGDAPLSSGDREALRLADERGWAMRLVDAPMLKWAYTVGLGETPGGAELIAFMPTPDGAANLLHDAVDHIHRGDLALADGLRWDGLGFEGCWRRVDESQYLGLNVFFLAKLRHEQRTGRREALPAYQFFLPDNAGRYPWEDGCVAPLKAMQPLLFEPFEPNPRHRPLAAPMRM